MFFQVEESGDFSASHWDMDFNGLGIGRGQVGVVHHKQLAFFAHGQFVDARR